MIISGCGWHVVFCGKEVPSIKLQEKAKAVRIHIPAIFLALKRKDTPAAAKILAGITIAYALSPVDFIPDLIPVLGYLDDLIILPLLIRLTVRLIPPGILEECRIDAEGLWKDGKPRRWYFAIPVVALWVLAAGWLALKLAGKL